jgi:predicted transcriptional regulator
MSSEHKTELVEMTSDIVSAYVAGNSIAASDLPALIERVYGALAGLNGQAAAPAPVELIPAVPAKKSISADYIICLEDGKKFKSLKRHLRTRYNLSPEEYRAKWGLPADYPMVAPNYALARSNLAKKMGLGQSRKRA